MHLIHQNLMRLYSFIDGFSIRLGDNRKCFVLLVTLYMYMDDNDGQVKKEKIIRNLSLCTK